MTKYKIGAAASIAQQFVAAGDTVLDIGAADGVYTAVYAHRVGPTGSVLAIDPHREHVRTMGPLMSLLPQVSVRHGAVGAALGTARFYPDRVDPKRSSLWAANVPMRGTSYRVPVTTVDTLVDALPRMPALITVDTQGAEAAILAGAQDTLRRPVVWVIEVWASGLAQAGATVADVLEPFQAHGYRPHSVSGARVTWDEAATFAAGRLGPQHADFVMVPA